LVIRDETRGRSAGGVKVGEEGRLAMAAFGPEGFFFGLHAMSVSVEWHVISVTECTMDLVDILLVVGLDFLPSLPRWYWFSWLVVQAERLVLGGVFQYRASCV
jgi:hypothetical protein